MTRLIRPHISDATKLQVVLRQLGDMWPGPVMEYVRINRCLRRTLATKLESLAELLGCETGDLRLDHDPALGVRQKIFDKAGEHVGYIPRANDPEHLVYRPHGPQFERSHLVKTNIRGDHGQFPDRALIVRNRKLEKRLAEERAIRRKPRFLVEKPQRRPRKKWSRPLKSANRWPPKGGQRLSRKGPHSR